MADYALLKKSIKKMEFRQWAEKVKSKRHELEQAKIGQDPEYLETMELLLDISQKEGWEDWAQQDATKDGTDPGYYTVEQMLDRALRQADLKSVNKSISNSAGAHYGAGKDQKQRPQGQDKDCTKCGQKFKALRHFHKTCSKCHQETRGDDFKRLSSDKKGQELKEKQDKKRGRDFARKAHAKKAEAESASDSESESD